jgi:peroxiredoxin
MNMNTGLIFAVLAPITAIGTLGYYQPKMARNQAPLRPRLEQAFMILALAFAGLAFAMQPGIASYGLAGLAILPAALFLVLTATSGLPQKKLAVAVQAMAPDFLATDADGSPFRLSELRGSAVLLKFYRGYWCPYCVAELAQLDRYAKEFDALDVKLVAVSSDHVGELRPFKKKHNWAITLLADPDLAVHRLYNVQHRNFAPKRGPFRELANPTTILIDKEGRVLWLDQTPDFRVRPQAAIVLAKTRTLLPDDPAKAQEPSTCTVCAA